MKKKCEYENCGRKVFATEGLTGTEMKLCEDHFKLLFGNLIRNAKIIDKTND